jgi:N,N'-diacetyllegionaminate synthase
MAKIIAEIGWNHMGDMKLAEDMISSAAENGADYCKFQTWSEDKLKPGLWDTDGRREIYKEAQLSEDDHHFLKEVCSKHSVEFMTSVFNKNDLPMLERLNMDIIKIPSHEVHNIELIQEAAKLFDTIIVSTGASKWDEVINIVEKVEKRQLILMHCVSTYPCPFNQANFPRIDFLRESFDVSVGYSGHCEGIEDGIAAVSKGVDFVEKHFTTDQNLPGRDNKFAILPEQMKNLSQFRDHFLEMKIDLGKNLQECEMDTFQNYRGRWSKDG